ncbi:MAG: serine/threonine protein kinase [Nannocystis sp.]|nr:serine/threonine protein kinase [Nannocystis sp.]
MSGQAQAASTEALIGTIIAGRYRIDALIGEGGMGAVYRGFHLHLRRDFAVKVLHPDVTRDPEIARRFEREAQSAARLDHVNCIQVTEFGTTDDGTKYMVMQLLEGIELHDLVRGPLEVPRAIGLFIQVIAGLEHAHAKGVVHRDLKPQNVFVTRDADGNEVLKLVDFGIAKIVAGEGAGEAMTRAGLVFGTPLYMSPEQCLGVEVDGRADLYAAGILLYLMLSGKLPFYSEDPVAVIRMQVSQEPPPLPASVPADLAAIVSRLLAKQRDQRFPDATTVRKILEGYRKSLSGRGSKTVDATRVVAAMMPPGAYHETLPEGVRPRPLTTFELIADRRSLRPWLLGGGVLLVIALVIVSIVLSGADLPEPAPPETPPAQSKIPEPEPPPAEPPPVLHATPQELAELDRLLHAGELVAAAESLGHLRGRTPEAPELLWRDGWLRRLRDADITAALASLQEALRRAPELAQDPDYLSQVDLLIGHPELRADAVDLALALGPAGHAHLLAFVNDIDQVLSYGARRRALQALAADPELAAAVDHPLNLIRDVEQHREAPRPCEALTASLMEILAAPDAAYYETVVDTDAPRTVPGAAPEEIAACAALPKLLEKTRKKLAPLAKKKKRKPKKPAPKKGLLDRLKR